MRPSVWLLALLPACAATRLGRGTRHVGVCITDGREVPLRGLAFYLVTSMDVGAPKLRTSVGLDGVEASTLATVSDARICDRAAAAINVLAKTPGRVRELAVVTAGPERHFVRDPLARAGEWGQSFVFDSKFKLIETLLGP